MDMIWNAINSLAALGALIIAAKTYNAGKTRAISENERLERIELENSINLSIIALNRSYWGYPLYAFANDGTATVRNIQIEPESVVGVGIDGSMSEWQLLPGQVGKSTFAFKTTLLEEIPQSVKVTFSHPYQGERHLRVPPHPIDVRERRPRPGEPGYE